MFDAGVRGKRERESRKARVRQRRRDGESERDGMELVYMKCEQVRKERAEEKQSEAEKQGMKE